MKKVEIIKLDIKSVFKVTIYFMIIPMLIFFLIGIISIIFGVSTGNSEISILGILYLIMPIIIILFYGAIAALMGLIYNIFSKKFGGFGYYVRNDENNEVL